MEKKISIIITIFSILVINSAIANSNKQHLEKITHKIKSIKTDLNHKQLKRSQVQQDLAETETESNLLQLKLNQTKKSLTKQHKKLHNLTNKKNQFQQQLGRLKTNLDNQIRMAYLLGNEPTLKILLNQNNVNQANRLLVYYRYLSNQQLKTIKKLQTILENLKINQHNLAIQVQKINSLKLKQLDEKFDLLVMQKNRQQLIHRLNHTISSDKQQLTRLIANKRSLEKILKRLNNQSINAKSSTYFKNLMGKLTWPTSGKILNYFGTKINQSELRWNGILIKAHRDQPVRAIANGTVVFAKWMPGYGLLMIIDHGGGYMSLYGRNHLLYKHVGEKVRADDVIASVGETGGYQYPALYFAIRHNGKPLSPTKWCKS